MALSLSLSFFTRSLSLLHILFLYHTLSSSPIPIHSTPYFLTFTHLFHKSLQHNSFLSLSSLNSNSIITQTAKLFLAFTHTYLRTLSLSLSFSYCYIFSLSLPCYISLFFEHQNTHSHNRFHPIIFFFCGIKASQKGEFVLLCQK